jgi:ABC-type Zn uptake system ZnuABC Zn-binding protein ZnuA
VKTLTRRTSITLLGSLAVAAFALPLHAAPKKYPYSITTTVGMVNDIVQNVAGDKAKATAVMWIPIFTNPHGMMFPR